MNRASGGRAGGDDRRGIIVILSDDHGARAMGATNINTEELDPHTIAPYQSTHNTDGIINQCLDNTHEVISDA